MQVEPAAYRPAARGQDAGTTSRTGTARGGVPFLTSVRATLCPGSGAAACYGFLAGRGWSGILAGMGSALLVVDVQNGVVEGIPCRDSVVATIAGLVDAARAARRPVVWVQHSDEDLPPGSAAFDLVPQLRPADGELRVEKQHRSAFGGTGLGDALRAVGVTRLVLVGTQSAFCVDMAGKHALAEGFDVTLVSDGHGNGDLDTLEGRVDDATVRALVNRTWSSLRHPGRDVQVIRGDAVRW